MSFEDQHFQEQYDRMVTEQTPDYVFGSQRVFKQRDVELRNEDLTKEILGDFNSVANNFKTELHDIACRLQTSCIASLTSAGEDIINALAKLELLKQSL